MFLVQWNVLEKIFNERRMERVNEKDTQQQQERQCRRKRQNKKWKKKSKEKQVLLLFHADQKSLNDFFMTDKGFSLHSFSTKKRSIFFIILLLLLFSLRLSILIL